MARNPALQWVSTLTGWPGGLRRDRLDQRRSMAADLPVDGDVLLADLGGAAIGGGEPLLARAVAHRRRHLIERPSEVDRGRTGGEQHRPRALERFVGGIGAQRQAHAVGGRRPDQRRAPHLHGEMACAATSSVSRRSVTSRWQLV